jgi:hypothetical protein
MRLLQNRKEGTKSSQHHHAREAHNMAADNILVRAGENIRVYFYF